MHPKTQPCQTDLLNKSDEFKDSDDNNYINQSGHAEYQRYSIKQPKNQPIANNIPIEPEAVGDFKLRDLSLLNLKTVQRGLLTCEFFQSKVIYSFSWTEDRECSAGHSPNKDNTPRKEYNRSEMNNIHG